MQDARQRIAVAFQFHKGTIKTGAEGVHILAPVDFNSIKVRLKLRMREHRKCRLINFNSIKVRLKPHSAWNDTDAFNISIP